MSPHSVAETPNGIPRLSTQLSKSGWLTPTQITSILKQAIADFYRIRCIPAPISKSAGYDWDRPSSAHPNFDNKMTLFRLHLLDHLQHTAARQEGD